MIDERFGRWLGTVILALIALAIAAAALWVFALGLAGFWTLLAVPIASTVAGWLASIGLPQPTSAWISIVLSTIGTVSVVLGAVALWVITARRLFRLQMAMLAMLFRATKLDGKAIGWALDETGDLSKQVDSLKQRLDLIEKHLGL